MNREPTVWELQLQIDEVARRLDDTIKGQDKMAEKLAQQNREDKAAANEWRGTINDFIAVLRGQKSGISSTWSVLISLISVAIAVYAATKGGVP